MPVQRAMAAFKTERLNCAQSVLRAFQQELGLPEDAILAAKQHGGGRAEGGCCGALYGALQLTADASIRERLSQAFVAKAGSHLCADIRGDQTFTCDECVALAAELFSTIGKTA